MKFLKILLSVSLMLMAFAGLAQNIALNKPATASAIEGAFVATNATDGNTESRWASAYESPSWVRIDLGQTYTINQVILNWERASAESYHILISDIDTAPDPGAAEWSIVKTQTGMADEARIDDLQNLSASGRYIAMFGTNKLHPWGYSLYEFEVYPGISNQPPTVMAGSDQTITLPTNSLTLSGSANDPDGSIASWSWVKVSGGSSNILSPTSETTQITGLDQGVYVFRLTATDNQGATGFDEIQITVQAAQQGCGGANLALNKSAVSSSQQGDFTAGNAFDADGGTRWGSDFSDDEWIRVDLEGTFNICRVNLEWEGAFGSDYEIRLGSSADINTASVIATVNGGDGGEDIVSTNASISGRYLWMRGLSRGTGWGYSLWEMQVFGESGTTNTPPTAQAGSDQELASGTTTTTLSGSGADADGDAITFSWTQTAGAPVTIASPSNAITTINGLANGQSYTFQLVTNDGQSSSNPDFITINVVDEPQGCGTANVALNKPATASSHEGAYDASSAFDGDGATRWGSNFNDDEWIMVDLEGNYNICQVTLQWEGAFGSEYEIRLSSTSDINAASVIATVNNGDGGEDIVQTNSAASGRYLWMKGISRGTGWGYSLWEMQVFAGQGGSEDNTPPGNPGNLSAAAAVYAVTVSWSSATDNVGVESYRIYEGGTLKSTVDGSSLSMTISGLDPGTQYTYTVKAVDAAGNESSGADVTFTTNEDDNTDGAIGIGNVALSLPAYASSVVEGSANVANNAVDGNMGSRWESAFTDDEWFTVDLGLKYQIGRVILHWETASGRHYLIQTSDDNVNWNTIYEFDQTVPTDEPRTDDLLVSGSGQYVRMQGIERNTPWSYSLFEFEVYSPGSGPEDIPDPNPNPNPAPVPPGPVTFNVVAPTNGAMITNTRFPTLSWEASPGATSYEVWVNVTKTDYDWHAWGDLLDRFTLLGEVSGTTFTLQQPLPDRWTYKWYVVAKGSGTTYSSLGQFSVYLPVVEQQNDGIALINGMRDLNKNGAIETYEDWHQPIEARINDLMARMTIEEKAYQMFYNAQSYPLSGWAFGPGTVNDMFNRQLASANTRLGIPFVSAGDCIHGYSTTYPTQSALAASRNLELVRQCGDMQRVEQKAVGFRGTLAPLAEVGTKVLYPRIQEGCGEDADFAAAMVRAMVCGLQAGPELNPNSVLVTTKHWPGEGAGGEALIVYDGVTIKYHMKPWFANVDANAGSIMPGYAGSSYLDPGGPGAGDSKPILDYLRDVVKFDGVITTDWLPYSAWVDAALAGSDVMGGADPGAVGFSMASFINDVGETRINEAVRRILDVKFRLGVFEDPYGDPVNGPDTWFTPDHVEIATQAAREAMTLLKNDGVMPLNLSSGANLLVTGARANDGSGHSVWTSYFHDEYGAKTMFEAIQEKGQTQGVNVYLDNAPNPDAAIVIVGEPTYTHGTSWDKEKPYLHDAYYAISDTYEYDLSTLNSVKAMGIPYVVVVVMPRPYVLTEVVNDANAVLIAYRPGDGGGSALADVLFGDFAPQGKLPWQLPRSMDQIGLDNLSQANERWDLPFDLGATPSEIQEIRSKIASGEHIEAIYGNPLFQYGYGIDGYSSARISSHAEPKTELETSISEIVLYPNPVNSTLNVFVLEPKNGLKYEIYSVFGQRLIIGDSQLGEFTVDLSKLDMGYYILRIQSENRQYSKIFLKN